MNLRRWPLTFWSRKVCYFLSFFSCKVNLAKLYIKNVISKYIFYKWYDLIISWFNQQGICLVPVCILYIINCICFARAFFSMLCLALLGLVLKYWNESLFPDLSFIYITPVVGMFPQFLPPFLLFQLFHLSPFTALTVHPSFHPTQPPCFSSFPNNPLSSPSQFNNKVNGKHLIAFTTFLLPLSIHFEKVLARPLSYFLHNFKKTFARKKQQPFV